MTLFSLKSVPAPVPLSVSILIELVVIPVLSAQANLGDPATPELHIAI